MYLLTSEELGQLSELENSNRNANSNSQKLLGEVLPYRAAMESIRQGLQEEYKRNCVGVNVLKTLSRESLTPLEKVKKLERKLSVISRLVQGQKLISKVVGQYQRGKMNKKQLVSSLHGIFHAFPELKEFPFPKGYAVGSEAEERARVQCELSQARWEWFASQYGGSSSKRVLLKGLGQVTAEGVCSGYKSGEIKTSKTQKGHLPTDVRFTDRGLEITDFGVNWRSVKDSTKQEQLLKDWLNKFETTPNYQLRIIGYSDCIGKEKNNKFLREGRAKHIYELLGKSARSRTIFVGAASPGTYLSDNSTVAGRALNRGVVIEIYQPKPKPTCPYSLRDSLKVELEAARKTLGLSSYVAKDFLRTVGALDARGRFTETILDNKYWFAKLYELITYYEIAEIHRFEYPAFVLHFIPIFYNLYHKSLQHFWKQENDQISQLWINHFRNAGRPSWNSVSGFTNQVLNSIITGVAAHIQGDMAIALEQAYRSYVAKYCLSNVRFDDFRKDFFENNRPIFDKVQAAFFLELSRRGPFPVRPEVGQFIIGTGTQLMGGGLDIDEVYRWRAEAWAKAKQRLGQ